MSGKKWQKDELAKLKKLYLDDKLRYKQISQILNRSVFSVRSKVLELDYANRSQIWTDEEIENLRCLIEDKGYTATEAALYTGRPKQVTIDKARFYGFSSLAVNERLKNQKLKRCPECKTVFSIAIYQARYCKPCRSKLQSKKRYSSYENYLKSLCNVTRGRCANKNIEIDIDYEYFLKLYKDQNGLCFYTDLKMTFDKSLETKITYSNISIDRIDSNKGYIKGNVVLCCAIINIMKNTLTVDELYTWTELILNKKNTVLSLL